MRAATVSADRTLSIRSVPPGDRFLAIAVDGLLLGEHREPEVLSALRPLAQPLSLQAGQRHDLALHAVAWPVR